MLTSTKLSLAGLGAGVAGLVIQWIADPPKFGGFPPGILVIAACATLVALTARRWWWGPVFGVLVSLWIVLGGWAAGKLTPNFSADAGTATGTAVMTAGLAFAAVTGVVAMVAGRRARAEAAAP